MHGKEGSNRVCDLVVILGGEDPGSYYDPGTSHNTYYKNKY